MRIISVVLYQYAEGSGIIVDGGSGEKKPAAVQ